MSSLILIEMICLLVCVISEQNYTAWNFWRKLQSHLDIFLHGFENVLKQDNNLCYAVAVSTWRQAPKADGICSPAHHVTMHGFHIHWKTWKAWKNGSTFSTEGKSVGFEHTGKVWEFYPIYWKSGSFSQFLFLFLIEVCFKVDFCVCQTKHWKNTGKWKSVSSGFKSFYMFGKKQ